MKLLVTAVGGAIGQGIMKAARMSKLECEIVAVDAQPFAAGLYRGDVGYIVPLANNGEFINEIIKICNKENIEGILVGTDYELLKFAENKEQIEKETAARVIVSLPEQVNIANDKWLTHQFLVKNGLPHIHSVLLGDIDDLPSFPLIVKPRVGDSSKDTFIVNNKKELNEKLGLFQNKKTSNIYLPDAEPIIQEYISSENEEYTSTTVTFNSHCFGVLSMNREMRFGGHTTKAIIDDFPDINKKIKKVAEIFNAFGPANFQSRIQNDEPKIFEINCRFSGTTPLCAEVGFNTVETVLRKVLLGESPGEMTYENAIILRYFNELLVDMEDYQKLRKTRFIKKPQSRVNEAF